MKNMATSEFKVRPNEKELGGQTLRHFYKMFDRWLSLHDLLAERSPPLWYFIQFKIKIWCHYGHFSKLIIFVQTSSKIRCIRLDVLSPYAS